MAVEDAVEQIIGRFGRYQTWILFIILVGRYPTEFQLTNVVFILPKANYICLDEGANNSTNYCPCRNPMYDTSDVVTSVTSEFNLICDREPLASLAQSMLQIGILAGSLIFGYLSDRYGRKITVVLSQFTTAVFVALSAAGSELWMFMVCRFLIGASVGGTMLCSYVLTIELSGKSFRPQVIGLHEVSYITGYLFMPMIAYFVREWRSLQLITSAPWLYIPIYFWLLPESPRWLITAGKTEQAVAVLTNIAKKNNRPTEDIPKIIDCAINNPLSEQKQASFLDLFKTRKVRLYTIINALVWMFCAHTFFGINQFIGRLEGNLYLNVILSALSLVPGLVIVVVTAIYFSRRLCAITSFSVAGVSLLLFVIIPSDAQTATQAFAIIGQCGAFASFVLMYLYSSEIFPTVIRNTAMGFASVFARFGSFIAPFVVNIEAEWASIVIFSSIAFLAAALCYFLPETHDTVLLNTIEETERLRDKK